MTNFYCAAPWRGLHINPRGDVKTCCAGDPNMLGNLNNQRIEEILHGPVMQQIRQSIRDGKPHDYCYNCVQAERYGHSERNWHNDVSPEFDATTATDLEHQPVLIDVRWNTTCNLSCNYCGEACSSKWAGIKNIPFKSGTRPYYEQVCDFIEQHYEHIHEVALVGGEPLLLPENNRLLEVIPDTAIVTLITNLNVDLQTNKIFRKLAQRKRVGWSMSFDNIDQRFEYVRHGGDWMMLQENLKTIQGLMKSQGQWGGVHAVYNIYNATRICEFRQFVESAGATVLWQNLFQPEYLDPFLHGPAVAELAAKEIENFFAMNMATPAEHQFFDQALNNYRAVTQERPGITQHFRQHIHDNETRYHPDTAGKFKQLWPELAERISL